MTTVKGKGSMARMRSARQGLALWALVIHIQQNEKGCTIGVSRMARITFSSLFGAKKSPLERIRQGGFWQEIGSSIADLAEVWRSAP